MRYCMGGEERINVERILGKAVQGKPQQNRGFAIPCPEKWNWKEGDGAGSQEALRSLAMPSCWGQFLEGDQMKTAF